MCGAEKQSQRVRAHEGVVGRRKSQWTIDSSQNSGTYIVYNSRMTCSNSFFFIGYGYAHVSLLCFPLVMLFVPHWLLAQAHFYGRTHLQPSLSSTTSIGQGHIPIIPLLILFSVRWSDTQLLWVWWHFGYHFVYSIFGRMQLSQHPPIHSTCGHDKIPVITPILSMYLYSHMQVTLIYYTLNYSG